MNYTVHHDITSGICGIRVSGVHKRPEDSHELMRIAGLFAAEHGCSRFIFDMRRATVVGSTMDAYKTAIDPEKHGVSKRFRVASVYSSVTKDDRFIENIGVNNGATALRIFDSIDKAREWIASK